MSDERHTIHIRIRDLRRAHSLTQEELAEHLGLSRQSINAMEAGRNLPSLPVAMQIASFFAVPLSAIFGDDQSTSNHDVRKENDMTHLTPWSPLRDMREMLDEMMDTMHAPALPAMAMPAVNISQDDKEVHVDLRLPGFKKEDLSIEVGEDFVTVSGEMKQEEEDKGKQFVRREFAHQSFTRTVALPALVETNEASAEMKNGVLHVTLKKMQEEPPKTKRIEIKAE